MARNYAALPHEYLEEMDTLSDAEFGRLCRALLRYSMAGEEGRLQGAEKVVWKRVKMQEDRFQASYKELTDSRRAAGKKGAAKRWHHMADDGTAIADDGKNTYTETETKTETETNLPPPGGGRDTAPPPGETNPPTLEQVREAARLRGCPECAQPFFDYYAAAGWRDSEGKPCAWNWRQKLVAWHTREEKRGKERGGPEGGKPGRFPPAGHGAPAPKEVRELLAQTDRYWKRLKEGDGP